ncbi:MAG: sigma-70 family RNA polymerase sigma factor [Candidatus Binataceae bacterium]
MASKDSPAGAARQRFEQEALPHLDYLYSAAIRLTRNPDDGADLLQETVLRAWRFFNQFTSGTNCRAWMLTILYNAFRNGYRRGAREQPATSPEDFERRADIESLNSDSAPRSPESLVMDRVLDYEVETALNELPEEFRTAVLMVDIQEIGYAEAAQVLGLPIGTVKSRVSRARAAMRRKLEDYAASRRLRKPA